MTRDRLIELATANPIQPTGDFDELRGIHRHLFQDLYDWAGRPRTVDISKPGSPSFLPASVITAGSQFAFDELRADKHLRGLNHDQFTERLAHHFDAVNFLHPFREGNGRTQRVFWSRVARDAGWHLNWRHVTAERNNHAARAAMMHSDLAPLQDMFQDITTLARNHPTRAALDLVHAAFPTAATDTTHQTPNHPNHPHRPTPRTLRANEPDNNTLGRGD